MTKRFEELKTRQAKIDRIKSKENKYVEIKEIEGKGVKKINHKTLLEDTKNRYDMALEEGGDPLEQFTIKQLYDNYVHLYRMFGRVR